MLSSRAKPTTCSLRSGKSACLGKPFKCHQAGPGRRPAISNQGRGTLAGLEIVPLDAVDAFLDRHINEETLYTTLRGVRYFSGLSIYLCTSLVFRDKSCAFHLCTSAHRAGPHSHSRLQHNGVSGLARVKNSSRNL